MGDIAGKLIGVVLAFVLCILSPLTITVMSDDMADRRVIYSDMTSFVDEVVDTATITKAQLEDFYAAINTHGPICQVQITRYVRAANPDTSGSVELTYMPVDVTVDTGNSDIIEKFNKGDLIKVHVTAKDYTGAQRVGRNLLGAFLTPIEYSITARVR